MYDKDYVLSNGNEYVRSIDDDIKDHLVVHWTKSNSQAQRFTKPTAETLAMNFNWRIVALNF